MKKKIRTKTSWEKERRYKTKKNHDEDDDEEESERDGRKRSKKVYLVKPFDCFFFFSNYLATDKRNVLNSKTPENCMNDVLAARIYSSFQLAKVTESNAET